MCTIFVFCTTDITPSLWADFVDSSHRGPFYEPEAHPLGFILVREPLQSNFDGGNTPAEIESFNTRFDSVNDAALETAFYSLLARILDDPARGDVGGYIARDIFAILDEQSGKDRTVVIKFEDQEWVDEDENVTDDIEIAGSREPRKVWKSYRILFEDVRFVVGIPNLMPGELVNDLEMADMGESQPDSWADEESVARMSVRKQEREGRDQ
ncbi:hypothetical protein K469DRAFT_756277 [Zopfia rhizophila CBS 207.26]|uniref:Uncharacterized protein n=1 Tax=Zopfia rhizophila CBS 207.26 TaxID=1314779 RepID=A0A6A6D8H0_9PEZI|nr:hypothetical protein K469DRAFT_756277 [Zopfia rhizophila CBS 207.26]